MTASMPDRQPKYPVVPIVLSMLWLCWVPGRAAAHALHVECHLRGQQIEVRALFDTGERPAGATVKVWNATGQLIAQGLTREDGTWEFSAPPPGSYKVVVDAGAGHRAQTTIALGEEMPADSRISSGPSEEEFLRGKWLRIATGLTLIAGFCLLLWAIHRYNRPRGQPPGQSG